jgi:hypothetical protein
MKRHQIDILPSPATIVRAQTGHDKAEFERAVRQQVAEIMAERDAVVFEPFFRSRQVAYELKRLMTVPEQEKFSISFERYGCMICETHDVPHAGNGLCRKCRTKWFNRLAQIIGEGVKGESAQRARGTARAERLPPENAPQDGVHRSWYQRSSKADSLVYGRVADRLEVTRVYVRAVAIGTERSKSVSAAIKEERERMRNGNGDQRSQLLKLNRKWGSGATP